MPFKINTDLLKKLVPERKTQPQSRQQKRLFNIDKASLDKQVAKFMKERNDFLNYAVKNGYKRDLVIENSQVKNGLRTGDVYSVEYHDFTVTIVNKTKNRTTTLDLNYLLAGMSNVDKLKFLKTIQSLPGEVLEDLAIEVDTLISSTGKDMHILKESPGFLAGGYYSGNNDEITTSEKHIVHELGHAMDFHGSKNESRVMNNKKFINAFNIGLKRFLKDGNKQYDYNDNPDLFRSGLSVISHNSNYCTANPKELWAEIYTALTTGTCNSYNTILKYFPEALEIGKNLLEEIRNESRSTRHASKRIQNPLSRFGV